MDRVGGARLRAGEVPSRGCLSRGCSRHLVRTWPRVPTARPAGLVDICLAVSPHFHVKGRRDVTGDWGPPSAWGAHCAETWVPPEGWRVKDGREADRRHLQGEGGSAGQGCSGTICARPSLTAWARPPQGPPPRPRPGCADAGAPSNPQGQLWSQGLPTRPSCFSHGAASAGDSPRELPMGDQEAALPGDSLQH